MIAQRKFAVSNDYKALTPATVCAYLAGYKSITQRLGGKSESWKAREVGDGNLNLVFIVEGEKSTVIVKQALPYVRMVGESWPLPLDRAHYEHMALVEHGKWAADYVPEIYEHDTDMALTVMEYLSPHIILRKGLVRGLRYQSMARHLGTFLARTLFHTSDLYLSPVEKREKVAQFLTNTAMCKISGDLIFDEPYYNAPMNRHTAPQLDDIALKFRNETDLKLGVQELKNKFMNNAEALLHGDLHTGSVMVTEKETRVIDPEFSFYGPMGFDVGAIIGNFFMAYFAQSGLRPNAKSDHWILDQALTLWETFAEEFEQLWDNNKGEIYNPRLNTDSPELKKAALQARLAAIFEDALGFAGCKMIRRILGLAHVEDFEAIENPDQRANCERKALEFARSMIMDRTKFKTMSDVIKAIA